MIGNTARMAMFSPYQAMTWVLMIALAGLLAIHDTTDECVRKERHVITEKVQPLPKNRYPYLVENRYKQNQKWNPFLLQELPRSQELIYKYAFGDTSADNLISGLPPLTVHFTWCERGLFEFKHYLSVLSVAKIIKADKLVFHYIELPYHDMSEYNDWFERLFKELPHLVMKKMSGGDASKCTKKSTKMQFLATSVPSTGGIVVGLNTLVTKFNHEFRAGKQAPDQLLTNSALSKDAFIVFSKKDQNKVLPTSVVNCDTLFSSNGLECLHLPEYIFPKDIMEGNSNISMWARWLLYGFKEPISVVTSDKISIPRIAHYLFLDQKELTFLNYLSILSTISVAGMEKVYIHGKEPKGKYWETVRKLPNLVFLPEEFGKQIFEIKVKNTHSSKIFTASLILLNYGGIFVDDDVVWTNPNPSSWVHYAFSIGGLPSFTEEWPEIMNSGLMISQQSSTFLQNFIPTARNYDAQLREDVMSLDKILYRTYEDFPDHVNYKRDLVDIVTCVGRNNLTSQFTKSHPSANSGFFKSKFTYVEAVQVKFNTNVKEPENLEDLPCESLRVLAKEVMGKSGVGEMIVQ